jgi:hypothetical protein
MLSFLFDMFVNSKYLSNTGAISTNDVSCTVQQLGNYTGLSGVKTCQNHIRLHQLYKWCM